MEGVLNGFALIIVVVGAGYLTARAGIVQGDRRRVLNDVSFYVATPPLLFTMLSGSDPGILLSPVILVLALSAVLIAAGYIAVSLLWFKRDLATATLGATSAAYVNSNNLGLPIALYILGDVAYVAPLILVQQLVFSPVVLAILESSRGRGGRGVAKALGRTFRNPIILSCILGFVFATYEIPIPKIVYDPMAMVGAAAVPMILLSFGMSLHGQRVLEKGSDWVGVFVASALKMIAMPLVAWGFALAAGLGPHETLVAVVCAALPTAQMVYNYAVIYGRAEILVRDTVFVTTFGSLPVIALAAWLLTG